MHLLSVTLILKRRFTKRKVPRGGVYGGLVILAHPRLMLRECRGIGNRVGQPKRRQLFKRKMGRLGCSWAELGRCTADCRRQPAVPIANSRPRRNQPILLRTMKISRLARSWAELALA